MSSSQTAAQRMQSSSSQGVDNVCYDCRGGNRFWLENMSGSGVSLTFSVNGVSSPIIDAERGGDEPTLIPNTLDGSRGRLEMSVNGRAGVTLVDSIDNSYFRSPEDLACGVVVGPQGNRRNNERVDETRIPFSEIDNDVDMERFLPDGVSPENSDIDMVMVLLADSGEGAIRSAGMHEIDDLDEESVGWMLRSFAQNTFSSMANDVGELSLFLNSARREQGWRAARDALRELVFQGKFYVRQVASWGNRWAIVFRGAHTSRSFLTAITYGLKNNKISYISSYAQLAADVSDGAVTSAARTTVRTAAKGNLIGFFINASFDVHDFWIDEDPEKNWGDMLGALGVTFVKVFVAGAVGFIAAAAFAAGAIAITGASAPVLLIAGVGTVVAIAVGFGLDWLDERTGFKEKVKGTMRKIAGQINIWAERAANATVDFVDSVSNTVRQSIREWIDQVLSNVRHNNPTGWCAFFCSSPVDQVNAWRRGFFRVPEMRIGL